MKRSDYFILTSAFLSFLLSIYLWFSGQQDEENEVNIDKIETDITDYDGGGNYGRIPDKKPKNRAI